MARKKKIHWLPKEYYGTTGILVCGSSQRKNPEISPMVRDVTCEACLAKYEAWLVNEIDAVVEKISAFCDAKGIVSDGWIQALVTAYNSRFGEDDAGDELEEDTSEAN